MEQTQRLYQVRGEVAAGLWLVAFHFFPVVVYGIVVHLSEGMQSSRGQALAFTRLAWQQRRY
jgi:hypothetical protein